MPRSNSTEPSNAKSNAVAKGEGGNAIVEFVGVMGILVVPAVIALVVASALLLGQSAVTAAARDSARAFARSDTVAEAWVRAQSFADQALESRGIDSGAFLTISCSEDPCLSPDATVSVRVEADISVPYLSPIRMSREATMPVDEFRAIRD
ncbi:TadE family protein [Ancrocorticia populi]|uniref:TadE family protein n=1 Tax=Ancrocorticia populi TaxID=2175228 RepID=UPI0023559CCD|nr:TadE family protein [Ancrocorticia populi]